MRHVIFINFKLAVLSKSQANSLLFKRTDVPLKVLGHQLLNWSGLIIQNIKIGVLFENLYAVAMH